MTESPAAVEQPPAQPGRLRLTAYAAEQVLWMVPLVVGLVLFVVGGILVVVWVGVLLVAAAVPLIRLVANRQRRSRLA